jgi:hypothetical protein
MARKYKRKWTYEKVLESAKKFNHIFDWELGDQVAYRAALDLNIIKKIDKSLPRTPGKFLIWTEEKVLIEAKR